MASWFIVPSAHVLYTCLFTGSRHAMLLLYYITNGIIWFNGFSELSLHRIKARNELGWSLEGEASEPTAT